jgi:epoxyqueuosine reductase QueG
LTVLSDEELDEALKGSAMSRAKRAGIRRNVEISMSNSKG